MLNSLSPTKLGVRNPSSLAEPCVNEPLLLSMNPQSKTPPSPVKY